MEKIKRNTKTKQLVMSVLEKSKTALSHEAIEQKLSEKVDRVTIYRILNGFSEDGKVHKIMSEDGKTYFSPCHQCTNEMHNDNHAHFHCTKCDSITCMKEPLTFQPVPRGYNISSISTILTGICYKCNRVAISILLFFTCSLISFAQNKDTSHILHEVVVSDYASRLQGENVANVEKLTLKETPVLGISLSDKLTNVAGLDNYSTGIGIGKPVIRGLSGNRIAVFSQGVRIENQQWGDEHGLGLDDNGYEQVEIIKGPASLLYGSDALGGVLFFADERYAKNNSIDISLSSEFHSNTLGLRNTGALKLSKNKFHFNLFGGYTTHRDYLDGYNNPVPNSRFNTGDVKSTFAYTGKKFTTSLKYNYLNEKYGLTEIEDEHDEDEHEGEEHEGEEHEEEHEYSNGRTLYLPYQNLQTHLLAWENTLLLNNNSKLKLDFGYIFNNRQEFEDEHHHHEHEGEEHEGEEHEGEEHEDEDEHEHGEEAALNMNLHTISYNLKWYSPRWNKWDLTTGSQGMVQTNTNHGEETLIPDALTFDIGAFAMTNFYYSEKAYLQAGIRLDNRHISTSDKAFEKNYIAVNFSAGIFQPLAKYLSLRTNISTGFRAPNMFELLSDGVHHGTNRYEIGDNELKTENSYQIDASLNFESTHIEAFISPYFNYVKNFIYLQPTSEIIDETPVYNYKQADAFLYGGEAGIHLHPHPLDWLHIECSYSNTFGQNIHHNWLPLMPSQKIKANLSVIFTNPKILKKYSFYVQNIYSLAQNFTFVESGYAEAETPDYYLLNIGANFEFLFGKQRLLLNFSVNNLLNEKYFDHLSRYKDQGIYNMGRSFVVKLSLPITASI